MKNCSILIAFFVLLVSASMAQDVAKLQWSVTTGGGPNDFNRANVISAEKDPSGNIIIFGTFDYTADFDPGPGLFELTAVGNDDAFIVKLDPDGKFVWAGRFGDPSRFDANGMTVDKDGNIFIVGFFDDTMDFEPGPGVVNVTCETTGNSYLLKLDNNGAFVWLKQTSAQGLYNVDTDAAGNIFALGSIPGFSAEVNPDPSPAANIFLSHTGPFVWKLTAAGTYGWAQGFQAATRIAVDAAGDVLLTGQFSNTVQVFNETGFTNYTSAGSTDILVEKVRGSDGTYLWSGQMGGTTGEEAWGIITDASNNVYVTGLFGGPGDFDPGAGVISLTAPTTNYSTYICKISPGGNGSYAKSISATAGPVWPFSIAVDNTDLYIGGRFSTTADFDPGPAVYNITAIGPSDSFIERLDLITGDFKWAANFGKTGTGSESSAEGIIPVSPGTVVAVGAYRNAIDADPGPCVSTLTSGTGGYDIYAVKLSSGPPLPVPTLTSFTPTSGPIGTPVTITGTNFGPTPGDNFVQFNTTTAVVSANTTTTIDTSVPAGATTGRVKVTAYCTLLTSASDFTVTGVPTIINFTPTTGPVGTIVTINGTNFSTINANNLVKFNGVTAVVNTSAVNKITASVPVGATSGQISVTVGAAAPVISGANFIVTAPPLPTITSFTPVSGPEETLVVITGTNFSPTPSINDVKFNGVTATAISSTTTKINVTVPTGATTGKITVTIGTNTATSATDFTLTAPTATITVTTQPEDVDACEGNPVEFTTAATGTTNIQYQWQYSNDTNDPSYSNISNGGGINGATTATLTVVSTEDSEGLYRCFITGDNAASKRSSGALLTNIDCNNPPEPVIESQLLETQAGGIITLDLIPLITTADGEISELTIVTPPSSGAAASITAGVLTIDYTNVLFTGTESIVIAACDFFEQCVEQTFSIEVDAGSTELVVYNGMSPGGANPSLIIQNIETLQETKLNKVTIFDRWQNSVWSGTDYNNNSIVFKGTSDDGKDLPTGTYFYRIEFASGRKTMTGFISLKR